MLFDKDWMVRHLATILKGSIRDILLVDEMNTHVPCPAFDMDNLTIEYSKLCYSGIFLEKWDSSLPCPKEQCLLDEEFDHSARLRCISVMDYFDNTYCPWLIDWSMKQCQNLQLEAKSLCVEENIHEHIDNRKSFSITTAFTGKKCLLSTRIPHRDHLIIELLCLQREIWYWDSNFLKIPRIWYLDWNPVDR